jgi:acetyl-CoA C-acetyltransferase
MTFMAEAFVVEALRTPGGRRGGALAGFHPADLGAIVLDALIARTGIDPSAVDDVIIGCVSQIGEQSFHIARNIVLASCLPDSVPAVSIDRQCGSSQQAVHFAAQAVMSGVQDIVVAGGVESMTRVPMGTPVGLAAAARLGIGPWSDRIRRRYGVDEFSQFVGADLVAAKYGLDRDALDAYALESHRKAARATEAAAFVRELVPIDIDDGAGGVTTHLRDEGVRSDATLEAIGSVKLLKENGFHSAATASQICDGASALMVVSERALKMHDLKPIARVHAMAVTAGDPVIMLDEPVPATHRVLEKAGLRLDQIDLFEVNEAFAAIPLAWLQALGADPERLNVNGGGIALGHPLGATGTKLSATLIHALAARGGRFGLQVMCEGGGLANATIFEAL